MSRSYKKTPSCHVVKPDKWRKKEFNRRLRRCKQYEDLPSGKSYRKANESWDIADCHERFTTYEQFKGWKLEYGTYVDEKQCREEYEKWYLRK